MHIKRYNSTYFKHKLYDSSIRKAIKSLIDHNRIQKKYPVLQEIYEIKKDKYKGAILSSYEEYISEVSSEIMAVSLELSIFCILKVCFWSGLTFVSQRVEGIYDFFSDRPKTNSQFDHI